MLEKLMEMMNAWKLEQMVNDSIESEQFGLSLHVLPSSLTNDSCILNASEGDDQTLRLN